MPYLGGGAQDPGAPVCGAGGERQHRHAHQVRAISHPHALRQMHRQPDLPVERGRWAKARTHAELLCHAAIYI